MRTTALCRIVSAAGAAGFAILVPGAAAAQETVEGTCSGFAVSPSAAAVPASGGSGAFSISWDWGEPPSDGICIINCSYDDCRGSIGRVRRSASWMSATRSGDTVRYRVQANTGSSTRTGRLTVAGAVFTVRQPGRCPSTPGGVSPRSLRFGAAGGTRSVSVSGRRDCGWPVSDDRDWITLTPARASGAGTVQVRVAVNRSGARRGTVTIGGRSVSVSQDRLPMRPCPDPDVTPRSVRFGHAGGSATVRVVTPRTSVPCRGVGLLASADRDWITVERSGATIRASRNPTTAARTGTVTFRGGWLSIPVSVSQAGRPVPCPSSPSRVSPSSVGFGAGGGSRSVSVSGRSDCSWSVRDDRGWLSVPSRVSGGGSVTIRAQVNSGGGRSGAVTIGGRRVGVSQDAGRAPCPSSPSGVSPSSVSFGAGGGSRRVSVSGRSDCSWSVRGDRGWLSVPSRVSGGGSVAIRAQGNSGGGRSGAVTIGGRRVGVSQDAGRAPCPSSPSGVSPSSVSFGTGGGSRRVSVSGRSDCSWSVRDDRGWLSVPSRVSGGGSVTIRAQGNSGGERSGTVTIGGRSVSVSQDATCPTSPERVSSLRVSAPDTGGTFITGVPDPSDCSWPVSDDREWITTNKSRISGREKLWIIVEPNRSRFRSGTVTIGDWSINVFQAALTSLTAKRDELLEDYASRKGYGDSCAAWNSLQFTGREVFLWNTHRLHRSGMLKDVVGLNAIFGRDGHKCGGGEFNRTFMTMRPELQNKWIDVYRGQDTEFPEWRRTNDRACAWYAKVTCFVHRLCDCPHWPFDFQIETDDEDPRGQINFFASLDLFLFERSYYVNPGQEPCLSEAKWLPHDEVCESGEFCLCGSDGPCPLETPAPSSCRVNYFRDTRLLPESYKRGPAGETLTILEPADRLMFEMDQDYGTFHDSAPSCANMRTVYASNYGDPLWNWAPSACYNRPGSGFSDNHFTPGQTSIRALHVEELRERIDAQRRFFGLDAFVWTDSPILAGVTPIKAVHLTELRTALEGAYAAAGLDTPVYSSGSVVPGVTLIRSVHLSELHVAVVELERRP